MRTARGPYKGLCCRPGYVGELCPLALRRHDPLCPQPRLPRGCLPPYLICVRRQPHSKKDTMFTSNPSHHPQFPPPPPSQPYQDTNKGPTLATISCGCKLGLSMSADLDPCRYRYACVCEWEYADYGVSMLGYRSGLCFDPDAYARFLGELESPFTRPPVRCCSTYVE